MISQAPTHGSTISVSFTIADDDLGKILAFLTELRENLSGKTDYQQRKLQDQCV